MTTTIATPAAISSLIRNARDFFFVNISNFSCVRVRISMRLVSVLDVYVHALLDGTVKTEE